MASPREIINRQLEAYNAHDVERFSDLFSADAVLIDLPTGNVIARGRPSIRELYSARFRDNPQLKCVVHSRMDLADFALDRETVTGLSSGAVDIIAIYEVREELIRSVRFVRQEHVPSR